MKLTAYDLSELFIASAERHLSVAKIANSQTHFYSEKVGAEILQAMQDNYDSEKEYTSQIEWLTLADQSKEIDLIELHGGTI